MDKETRKKICEKIVRLAIKEADDRQQLRKDQYAYVFPKSFLLSAIRDCRGHYRETLTTWEQFVYEGGHAESSGGFVVVLRKGV